MAPGVNSSLLMETVCNQLYIRLFYCPENIASPEARLMSRQSSRYQYPRAIELGMSISGGVR